MKAGTGGSATHLAPPASIWYAEHHQTSEAILHAFNAKEWPWAADLIEQKLLPLMSHVWGASRHELNSLPRVD